MVYYTLRTRRLKPKERPKRKEFYLIRIYRPGYLILERHYEDSAKEPTRIMVFELCRNRQQKRQLFEEIALLIPENELLYVEDGAINVK